MRAQLYGVCPSTGKSGFIGQDYILYTRPCVWYCLDEEWESINVVEYVAGEWQALRDTLLPEDFAEMEAELVFTVIPIDPKVWGDDPEKWSDGGEEVRYPLDGVEVSRAASASSRKWSFEEMD